MLTTDFRFGAESSHKPGGNFSSVRAGKRPIAEVQVGGQAGLQLLQTPPLALDRPLTLFRHLIETSPLKEVLRLADVKPHCLGPVLAIYPTCLIAIQTILQRYWVEHHALCRSHYVTKI